MSKLKKILGQVEDLPALPDIAMKLIQLASNMDTEISEIIEVIEKDPSLTAKLLKLCNSSYYGLSKRIGSVQQAVVLLGYSTLYKIALTVSSSIYFKRGASGYGLSHEDLWKHSVGTAIASETIAHKYNRPKAQNAYTAGLLHDIGKVVLSEFVSDDIDRILTLVENKRSFTEAETEILGMDHAMIAGKLARRWKFPEALVEALKYHHEPHLAVADKELCAFTHMGNVITNTIGQGIGVDSFMNLISEEVEKMLPMDEAELEEIALITQQRVAEAESFILEAMPT